MSGSNPAAAFTQQVLQAETQAAESSLSPNRLWRVVQRRRRPFFAAAALVGTVAFARTVAQQVVSPIYNGQFTLLISNPVSTQANGGGGGSEGGGAIESLARNNQATDVPTLIQVLQSSSVLEPVVNKLRLEGYTTIPPVSVELTQTRTGSDAAGASVVASGVLRIRSSSTDPRALQRMLSLTQKAYLEWSLQQRRLQLSEGVRFLDQQEPLLRQRNTVLQNELKLFRQRNNLLSPEEDAKLLNGRMLDAQGQLLQLASARQQLLDIRRDVQQGRLTARSFNLGSVASSGAGGAGTASATGNGGLAAGLPSQGLLDEWQRLESAIGAARGQFQPDSPVLKGLIASQQRLRPALLSKQLEAVDAALRQNQDAITSMRQQLGSLQQAFAKQPQLLSDYEGLQQRIAIAAGNLENYLKTRDQFQLELAQNTTPWQVISSSSVQRSPASTGLGQGLMQALVLAGLAGFGAAIAKDRLDHVFHSPQEVEGELGLTLLGHIPYVAAFEGIRREERLMDRTGPNKNASKVDRYQRFYYQEALRNIYTSLRFVQAGTMPRSIAITSSTPAEGKSLVGILLAQSLAELGVNVLLVDADLRKPQLHLRLGLDNLRGLSNLLSDDDITWDRVVQQLPDQPNLNVITAGRRVPNPPRLLGSESMAGLVNQLASCGRFDMVIYDAPPVLGLADAALLTEHLEGLMLLVSLNQVDRSLPRQALKRLEQSNTRILGLITNARRPKGEDPGAYAYGYGRARQDPNQYAGYGALDPASAYAYYEGAGEESDQEKLEVRSLQEWLRQLRLSSLKKQLKRLNQWLDG